MLWLAMVILLSGAVLFAGGALVEESGWSWVLLAISVFMLVFGVVVGVMANEEADRLQRQQFREWDREDREWEEEEE